MTSSHAEKSVITKKTKNADTGWKNRGWYFTSKELRASPSLDVMTSGDEKDMKRSMHDFVYNGGKHLRVKSVVMATAATICQRYYAQRSFKEIRRYIVGSAALLLASKAEEFPEKMEKILMLSFDFWCNPAKDLEKREKYYKSEKFYDDSREVAIAEVFLMSAVDFDFNIEHTYPHMYNTVEIMAKNGWLKEDDQFAAIKGAIPLLNQSLRGTMCLEYPPSYRARMALFVALLSNGIPAPAHKKNNWSIALELGDEQVLKQACCQLLECLDEEDGQTGILLTKTIVYEALVIAGVVRNKNPGSKPRLPPTFEQRQKAGLHRALSSGKTLGKRRSSDDAITDGSMLWPRALPSDAGAASTAPSLALMTPPASRSGSMALSNSGPSVTRKSPIAPKSTTAWSPNPRPPAAPEYPPPTSKSRSSAPKHPSKLTAKPNPTRTFQPSQPRSKPRPPSTPKPPNMPKPLYIHKTTSTSKAPARPQPRPPSFPKPSRTLPPPPTLKPRPPSVPKPFTGSQSRPPSAAKPLSASTNPPTLKPRPPSAPKPPTTLNPRPPSVAKSSNSPNPPLGPTVPSISRPTSALNPSSASRPPSSSASQNVSARQSNGSPTGKRCRSGPDTDKEDTGGSKKCRLNG